MARPYRLSDPTKAGPGILRRGSITLEGIENLLAQVESVREVTSSMVSQVCLERKVDLATRLVRGRKQLYRRYLKHCFEDKVLTAEERADLAHLATLLHLSAEDLGALHDEVAIDVYGEAVGEVLEDFRLDDDEAEFLRELREQLGLADEKAERIYWAASDEARGLARSAAQSRDRQFSEYHAAAGEFTGRSDGTLEGAIDDALNKAVLAIPSLHWFEVTEIAGYIANRKAKGWHVTLRAGIRKEEP